MIIIDDKLNFLLFFICLVNLVYRVLFIVIKFYYLLLLDFLMNMS
jgi:hypothetical protein